VPNPLDPLSTFSKLFTPTSSPSEFVDRWVDATTWWVEPVTRTSSALRERMAPERMLAEMIDGVLGRFGGQRLEIVLRGQPVRGLLESLRVVGRDRALSVIADLSDVEWSGPRLAHLQARAHGVRMTPGLTAEVSTDGLDLEGRCDLDRIVEWAEGRTGPWTIAMDPDGRHLLADREDRPVGLTAEPTYENGRLELVLRAARWRGREIRIPRWLHLTRTQALPELPEGMEVHDAHLSDGTVSFRLGLAGATSQLDVGRLRDAVVRGGVVLIG
jgi:hypothetical protein